MGGLVVCVYLCDYGCDSVVCVIILGLLYYGMVIVNFGIGINCGEMNWLGCYEEGCSSEWLQKFVVIEEVDVLGYIVLIYFYYDNIVLLQILVYLEGVWNILVIGIGYVVLVLELFIYKMVIELIYNVCD